MSPETWGILFAGLVIGWLAHFALIRRLERKRARFLSYMAHEINGPITALNMTVMNFLDGTFGKISDDQKPWMTMIRAEVGRLAALIGDLRDILHLDFHRDLKIYPEDVEFDEIVESLREELSGGFERSKIPLKIRVESMPLLEGDPVRLRRVLGSMLVHARKFRSEGPVALFGEVAPDSVTFRVEYRGQTFPPGETKRALELYYPVENEDSQVLAGVGAGLGLPHALVAAHGGKMSLNVDSGGRTTISISLPRPREKKT